MKLAEAFGLVLKRERKKRGLTQVRLIEMTGLDRRTIQHYESAQRTPILQNIEILAKVLGMSPGALVDLVFDELNNHSR